MMNKRQQKEQRVENILLSLKKLDYLTREQIQTIHDLKGDRNANRFLNSMDEYLMKFRNDFEYVYYLSKKGRERIECDVIRTKTQNVAHILLRNQLWIYAGKPFNWENEIKISVDKISIVCDAKFVKDGIQHFVEIDLSQSMAKNKAKIERYKKIKELTGDEFKLIWVTELESRKPKLQKLMEGFPGSVYTLKEIR